MNVKLNAETMDELFRAILSLETVEECYRFFEDICTANELQTLSQRLQVARMLEQRRTYVEITEETGASTTTIGRVNRVLHYGNDGYQLVFERVFEEEEK